MPRIPPKGTPEYRLYFAVRRTVDEEKYRIKSTRKWVESWPDSERKTLFLKGIELQEQALKFFEEGHALPYLE